MTAIRCGGSGTIRVLAIDGGGVRGLLPALILGRLERALGTRIGRVFDVIAGTSTGSLLAAGLSQPPAKNGHVPEAGTLAEAYRNWSVSVFPNRAGILRRLSSDPGNVESLEELLGAYANGDLRDAATELIIPALDMATRSPVIFTRGAARELKTVTPIADVVMASSAAPTYLPPKKMMWEGKHWTLVDGGLFANSPALLAYLEIRDQYPRRPIRMLSIGCGAQDASAQRRDMSAWTRRLTGGPGDLTNAGWFRYGVDVYMDATSAFADQQMRFLLEHDYCRIQPKLKKRPSLDDASDEAVKRIQGAAASIWKRRRAEILDFVER